MTSSEAASDRVARWTITKSARVAHDEIFAPAGFVRRGTRSWRDDFLHREVYFYAARFRSPEERALCVSVGLTWRLLPPGAPEVRIGVELEEAYLQPLEPDGTLSAELLAALRGPVLDYLQRPQGASAFVDELLGYEVPEERHGVLRAVYGPAGFYFSAAWGALLMGDAVRCRAALNRVLQVLGDGSGWHRDEIAELERIWQRHHGSALA